MKLSAIIITFNEARHIARCINSLRGVADEIIVLDAFSTDRTPEICKEMGVKLIQRGWEGFSAAKNYANSLAEGSYILSIDADECLSAALQDSIARIKPTLQNAYRVKRRNLFCGKWVRYGGWYPDIKIRIFPKEGSLWIGEVHEKLEISGPSVMLTGDLIHYAFESRIQFFQKIEKYATLAAASLFKRGKKYNIALILFSPIFRFIKMYCFQLGFLDGATGFFIAKATAKGVFLRYKKLRELELRQERHS